MTMKTPGQLFVIAAPSGAGKTSLVKALIESLENITVSISHTTRAQRPGEKTGIHYYFIDAAQFQQMIDHGDFLEYATIFNHRYGTTRHWVEKTLTAGTDVILEIDWQGAEQIQKLFPDCISIFILPPSLQCLKERLQQRNQDKPDIIEERLADAKKTLSHIPQFDFLVLNDCFETAVNDLRTIVRAERLCTPRQMKKHQDLLAEFS